MNTQADVLREIVRLCGPVNNSDGTKRYAQDAWDIADEGELLHNADTILAHARRVVGKDETA